MKNFVVRNKLTRERIIKLSSVKIHSSICIDYTQKWIRYYNEIPFKGQQNF